MSLCDFAVDPCAALLPPDFFLALVLWKYAIGAPNSGTTKNFCPCWYESAALVNLTLVRSCWTMS